MLFEKYAWEPHQCHLLRTPSMSFEKYAWGAQVRVWGGFSFVMLIDEVGWKRPV